MANPKVRLGVSPLSWTNDDLEELGGETPLEQCLTEAAKAGYAGVELGRKFPRQADVLGPLLREHGLTLVSGWHSGLLSERPVEEELEAVRPHAELLSALGAGVMVYGECGYMPGPAPLEKPLSRSPCLAGIEAGAYEQRVTAFAEALKDRFGLSLAFHYHLMTLVEDACEIESFFAGTGDAVGLLLDTGHAVAAGAALEPIIGKFGARINHIHLKDVRMDVLRTIRGDDRSFCDGLREGMFTVPGDGDIDFSPVTSFVAESGYAGWLVVEADQDPQKAPPFETVTFARDFVTKAFSF